MVHRLVQYEGIVCKLLQKSKLTGGRRDANLSVLANLLVTERLHHFAGWLYAGLVHVKVVDVEEDDATAIEGNGAFQIYGGSAARGRELALFVTACRDFFERLD